MLNQPYDLGERVDCEGQVTYRVSRKNNFQADKLFLNLSTVITFEFYVQIVFQSMKFKKEIIQSGNPGELLLQPVP
jgi:hypothetical protein